MSDGISPYSPAVMWKPGAILKSFRYRIPLPGGYTTVSRWNGLPVCYAPKIPSLIRFNANADRAISEIGGRYIGKASGPVYRVGGPVTLSLDLWDPAATEATDRDNLTLKVLFADRTDGSRDLKPLLIVLIPKV